MGALHLSARYRPRLFHGAAAFLGKNDGLHHLTHGAVCQKHGRHTVLVRKVKGESGKIRHFLYGIGGEHYKMIVSVTAALGSLKIVGL